MNNISVLGNQLPVINDFNTYKNYVLSIPNLSECEERKLLNEFKVNNCLSCAQTLILSQLKTVIYISKKFKNYGLLEEDLVQEGNIGLMKAVKNFDMNHHVRLYTYSILWIKAEIQSYILKNWKIVKIGTTKNLKKLFFNFRQIQKEMIDMGIPKDQLIDVVSKKLDVSPSEVKDINSYFYNTDMSLDIEENETENEGVPQILQLTDNNTPEMALLESHDGNLRINLLKNVVLKLSTKQQEIIKMRFFDDEKKTHKEIANIMGISGERVRQIESESITIMKKILSKEYGINEVF